MSSVTILNKSTMRKKWKRLTAIGAALLLAYPCYTAITSSVEGIRYIGRRKAIKQMISNGDYSGALSRIEEYEQRSELTLDDALYFRNVTHIANARQTVSRLESLVSAGKKAEAQIELAHLNKKGAMKQYQFAKYAQRIEALVEASKTPLVLEATGKEETSQTSTTESMRPGEAFDLLESYFVTQAQPYEVLPVLKSFTEWAEKQSGALKTMAIARLYERGQDYIKAKAPRCSSIELGDEVIFYRTLGFTYSDNANMYFYDGVNIPNVPLGTRGIVYKNVRDNASDFAGFYVSAKGHNNDKAILALPSELKNVNAIRLEEIYRHLEKLNALAKR